jgi:predicted aspartyl protease
LTVHHRNSPHRRRGYRRVAGLLALAWLVPACAQISPVSAPAAPAACSSGRPTQVPLKIIRGQSGATLAFAPVTVNGKGPFLFTLDTGASQSLIDSRLATRLRLKTLGPTRTPVMGVTGQAQAKIVKITSWRAGSTPLPAATILSLPMARHHGFVGLLGSDILSRFRSVEVNYAEGRLTFCAGQVRA